MKFVSNNLVLIVGGVLAALFISAVISPKTAEGADGCSVQTMKGSYSYQAKGFYSAATGLAVFASSGSIIADGNGGIAVYDTASQNGVITRSRVLSGNYQIASSPAGSGGSILLTGSQSPMNFDFVLLNNGQKLNLIKTDAGTVITGSADLQTAPTIGS